MPSESNPPNAPDSRNVPPDELPEELPDGSHQPTLEQPSQGVRSSQSPTVATDATGVQLASDVQLAASEATLPAPSFRPPVKPTGRDTSAVSALRQGDRINDFEVEKILGKGAFGVVYLARQLSLDRRVALKIAANEGSEGRTMARLEHQHIVQVFSETVDDSGTRRLLCMQLVPGASLEGVICLLHRRGEDRDEWTGADYLGVVESRATVDDVLDTSALRDRELLAGYDAVQATSWVGARLAEAIDYAHQQGVLHRDIKPANILVNQYGRPMLADFNISFRSLDEGASADSSFGGTLAFMAPEHLDAFNPASGVSTAEVDERSDIYSLGIVVYELLTGGRPFKDPPRESGRTAYIRSLADLRRASPSPIPESPPSARKTLLRTLAKSLESEKADRFASGAAFAAALDGCRELQTAEHALPRPSWFARGAWKSPFLWLVLLAVGPQLIGSGVNIAYNLIEVVGRLQPDQLDLFWDRLVPLYNAVIYPLLIGVGVAAVAPVYKAWRRLESAERVDEAEVERARRRAVNLPYWMLGIAAAGWLPGGVLFPLMLNGLLEEEVSRSVFAHFVTSFTLSGLVAVAYSFCGLQFLALQVFYPRLWADPSHFRRRARKELSGTPFRLRLINVLSGAIPLVAIALILLLQKRDAQYGAPINTLLLSLLLLGGIGREITTTATSRMAKAYTALVGREA